MKKVYIISLWKLWRLDSVEIDYKKDVNSLNIKIDDLTKENQELRKENHLLLDDNARLKSIINNDSSNTSLPPSTDQKGGKPANTYNGRKKTERKKGGQKGHKGTTLTKAEIEGKIKSGKCRHEIRTIGDCSSGNYITKYVLDLSIASLITEIHIYADKKGKFHIPKEYRCDVTYGSNIKALAVSLYSEGVMSNDRIAAFLNAASRDELALSDGSVYAFCKKFNEIAKPSIQQLENELLNQSVVATDATTITVNGKQNYIRNFSIDKTVIYHAMKNKTIAALEKIGFLKKYTGILVHDYETALYHFGTDHAECNIHLLRYLRKSTEDAGNKWSDKMITLLCEMNKTRKKLISQEVSAFSKDIIADYEKKYQVFIAAGRKENKKTAHKYEKGEELTLLNRMEKYMHNHLLFLHNFQVIFDDNISERDLRKAKNRQKMAGGFRKDSGHVMYCSILTIIETLKRRKMGIIKNIAKLFMGTPAIF